MLIFSRLSIVPHPSSFDPLPHSMPSSMYNNSSSLPVTHELRDEFNRYATKVNHVLMFVQAILSFGGILGNLLALIVINRKSLRHTSSAVFITYLAIFDSAVLLIHAATLVRPRRNLFLHCSLTYLTELTTFNANWILVIITLGNLSSKPFAVLRHLSSLI